MYAFYEVESQYTPHWVHFFLLMHTSYYLFIDNEHRYIYITGYTVVQREISTARPAVRQLFGRTPGNTHGVCIWGLLGLNSALGNGCTVLWVHTTDSCDRGSCHSFNFSTAYSSPPIPNQQEESSKMFSCKAFNIPRSAVLTKRHTSVRQLEDIACPLLGWRARAPISRRRAAHLDRSNLAVDLLAYWPTSSAVC